MPTPYSGNSIVDYLSSLGQDSSFANRNVLATKYGISNYGGTADQNLSLLSKLRAGGAAPTSNPNNVTGNPAQGYVLPNATPGMNAGPTPLTPATPGMNAGPQKVDAVDPNQAYLDQLAKQFGYADYNAALKDLFATPEKGTQKTYEELYGAAGLGTLKQQIEADKQKLIDAEGRVSEDPWLAEASRVGKVKRLNDIAGQTIGNNIDRYNTGLNEVNGLVTRYSTDMATNAKVKEARLQFLTKAAEAKAAAAKEAAKAPDTVTIGNSLYRWDATQGKFVFVASAPKSGTPTPGDPGRDTVQPQNVPTFDEFIKEKQNQIGASIIDKEKYRDEYSQTYGGAAVGQQILSAVKNLRFGTVEESKRIIGNITELVNSGDIQGAEDTLRLFAYQKLKGQQLSDYDAYDGSISSFENSLAELDSSNLSAGPYKALLESSKPWLAIQKDQKFAAVKQLIELGQAQLRKAYYGTAVSEREGVNADKFLINDSDDIATIRTKLENSAVFLKWVNDNTIAKTVNLPRPSLKDYLASVQSASQYVSPGGNSYNLPY